MPTSLLEAMKTAGALTGVVIPPPVSTLLSALQLPAAPVADLPASGTVDLATDVPLVMGAALPAGAALDWRFATTPGRPGGSLTLTLRAQVSSPPIPAVFEANVAATGTGSTARATYTATARALTFAVTGNLRIELTAGGSKITVPALTLTPSKPDIILTGGFGLTLPTTAQITNGKLSLPDFKLVLPAMVPMLGSLPLRASMTDVAGGQVLTVTLPPTGDRPQVTGTLTWQLPDLPSLTDLIPTVTDISLHLPANQTPLGAGGPTVAHGVSIRAVVTRPPDQPDDVTVAVTATSDDPTGLVSGSGTSTGDKAMGITFTIGPALAATAGPAAPAAIGALYAASLALGDELAESGGYTLHGVTLEATPAAGVLKVSVDISGVVDVDDMDVGFAKVSMDDDHPMRLRWRGITATVDLGKAGAQGFGDALDLDFATARCDVVDPGGWQVQSLGDLLRVTGTRSGTGSTWLEVDLAFTLDLGPVKVSGAVVRGTWGDGAPSFGIRGLDASLELPGLVTGGGKIELVSGQGQSGIKALLWGTLLPLDVGGFLQFALITTADTTMSQFGMGVDLPAPIPLGPTGLGLYSVGATFGANAGMPPLDPADPLTSLRAWKPWDAMLPSQGDITLGAAVVVGTAADGGRLLNAMGVLGITVPDFALRIGVNASLFSDRPRLAEVVAGGATDGGAGLTLFGGLSATGDAIDVGIEGRYRIPAVVDVRLPVAGHFPFHAPDWYFNAGSDKGMGSVTRPPGPLEAYVFPDIPALKTGGWAFLMIAGNGIPDVAGKGISPQGFSVALGVGFSKTFGVKGILWASITTSLVAAIGTDPFVVWAQGQLSGEVGIGPFSLGVDAVLDLQIGPAGRVAFHLKVCAHVDLWFTELEGCIELGDLGSGATTDVDPADDEWPWPTVVLADGLGRLLSLPGDEPGEVAGSLGADGDAAGVLAPAAWSATPIVWADTIPLLTFPVAPVPAPGVEGEMGATNAGLSGAGRTRFRWDLLAVTLQRIDATGNADGPAEDLTRSAWQPPTGVAADELDISTARQLALLTRSRAVQYAHAGPQAAADPAGPFKGAAGLCGVRFRPGAAWTYGVDAQRLPGSADQWHVRRRTNLPGGLGGGSGAGIGLLLGPPTAQRPIPVDAVWYPAGPVGYPDPVVLADPDLSGSFTGSFRYRSAQAVISFAQEFGSLRYAVTFDEAVDSGDLVLRLRVPVDNGYDIGQVAAEMRQTALVMTAGGTLPPADVMLETVPGSSDVGELLARITMPTGKAVLGVQWGSAAATSVEVLGLHATSSAAAAAAEAAEAQRQAAAAADAAAAAAGAAPGAQRTILQPGQAYRLTVQLQWSRVVDDGSTPPPPPVVGVTRAATYFFRTAPKPPVEKGPASLVWLGTATQASAAMVLTTKTFTPEYLDRYLQGYTLPDRARFVFTADPPAAILTAPHVAELATAYGRDLRLTMLRTDRHAAALVKTPVLVGISALLDGRIIDPVAIAAQTFGCPLPPSQVSAAWPTKLQPSTPYEMSVAFPPTGKTASAASPRLRPVAFTTSAFAGPQELVASLGFTRSTLKKVTVLAVPTGHLAVADPAVRPAVGTRHTDDELEAALAALGLPPAPPAAATPRSSVLWSRADDGSWCVQGVLLEATEPMLRTEGTTAGDRMALTAASLGGGELPICRWDSSGTRVLWLAPAALRTTTAGQLRVRVSDRATSYVMRLTVPADPPMATSAITGAS